jgi:hypothetical protein
MGCDTERSITYDVDCLPVYILLAGLCTAILTRHDPARMGYGVITDR